MFFIIMFLFLAAGISLTLTFTLKMYEYWIFLWVASGIFGALIILVIFALLFLAIGSKTSPKSKFKVFILKNALWFAFKYNHTKVTSEGVENVPYNAPFVIYSNHKSMLDPAAIYVEISRVVSAVGKSTLWENKFMKMICDCFGAIPMNRENDREAAKNMIQAIKAVKNGLPMIIFPEGGIKTREVEEMVELKAGAYKLATKANAPIIPTTILGSSEISKKKRRENKHIHIIFHKAITPEEYAGKTTTEIGTYVENLINEDIHNYEK